MENAKMNFDKVTKNLISRGYSPTQAEREIGFAKTLIKKDHKLAKCRVDSLESAIEDIASIGLTLNPALNQANLLVKATKIGQTWTSRARLEPTYIGLIVLMKRSGSIKSLISNVVYSEDEFSIDLASDNPVVHKPNLKDRGDCIGVYSVVTFPDGTKQAEWMELVEVYKIRDYSESYKRDVEKKTSFSPWSNWFEGMARKSVIRRLYKYVPSEDSRELANAFEMLNDDYKATSKQIGYIESLLETAEISPEIYQDIEVGLRSGMTFTDAGKVIESLVEFQPKNKVLHGSNQVKKEEMQFAVSQAVERKNT